MINHVMNRPLAAHAVAWVVGTAVGGALPPGLLSWKAAIVAVALAVMLALLAIPGRQAVGLLLVAAAAAAYYQSCDARNKPTIVPPEAAAEAPANAEREAAVIGTIVSRVEVDGDRVSFTIRARSVGFAEAGETAQTTDKMQVSIRLLKPEEKERALALGRGDVVEIAGALKRPDPPRNFGAFDYGLYLYRKHIHWLFSAKGLDGMRTGAEAGAALAAAAPRDRFASLPDPVRLLRWNDDLRDRLGSVFDRLFAGDGPDSGYLKSLVLGLTDDMDPELYQQFSQLGLTHILAISGLHVAIFVAGCIWLLRVFGLTRERQLTITLLLVPMYVALTGGSPSAVRAGIMAMIGLYAARRLVWKDAPNIIGLAAVLMLLWEPYYLYDVSFQLSFLVTAFLIVGVPRFSRLLPIRSRHVNSLLSVTVVAQLASFPITVYYFNGISLLSAFANLILVPFISSVVLPLATFALMAGLASTHAGALIGWIVAKLNAATFWLVDTAAAHDPLRLVWPKPALWWIAVYYALLGAVYAGTIRRKEEGKPAVAYVSAAALMALLWFGYAPDMFDRNGKVSVIDVGQGDSILIRTPQSRHVLVDGGGTMTFRKPGEEWKERSDPYEVGKKLLVPLLKQRGVHRLDLLVVSHQDHDHIGGLQAVVEQIPVRAIVMNGTWKGSDSSRKLFETAMKRGTAIVSVPPGETIEADRHTRLTVLSAGGDKTARVAEEQNNESVVVLMQMRSTRFLFTGDMRAEDEKSLLASWSVGATQGTGPSGAPAEADRSPPPRYAPIDVLKVAHHGSKTSTSDEWLAYWRPKAAVVSVGLKNSYGHPNPGVVERLERSGSDIYRTDRDGEVVFTVTKNGLEIDTKL
ncbi:DNA internalization-related competence protein ComEC/Rec2 [Paenibacillus sp. GYB003]|uniref:DNA internalization-related competence protein ComEC/Rec2 n=1 Tax=Paenibacillus sp. GYB003 TaxID=2994392 RepID=UPI002F966200